MQRSKRRTELARRKFLWGCFFPAVHFVGFQRALKKRETPMERFTRTHRGKTSSRCDFARDTSYNKDLKKRRYEIHMTTRQSF